MPDPYATHLVIRAQAGDPDAFASLVDDWTDAVHAIVLARSTDPRAAEDLVQTTFLEAWRKLGQLRDPGAFGGWLRRIARSVSRDDARRRAVRPALSAAPARPVQAPASDSPEHQARAREAQRDLVAALESLEASERELLLLYHLQQCSTAELAQRLGRSQAAVRQRLSRARRAVSAGLTAALVAWLHQAQLGPAFRSRVHGALAAAPGPSLHWAARPWVAPTVLSLLAAGGMLLVGSHLWRSAQVEAGARDPVEVSAAAAAAPHRAPPLGPPLGTASAAGVPAARSAARQPGLEEAIRGSLDAFPEHAPTWGHLDLECAEHGETCLLSVDVPGAAEAPTALLYLNRGLRDQGVDIAQFMPEPGPGPGPCEPDAAYRIHAWFSLRDAGMEPPPERPLRGARVEDLRPIESLVVDWFAEDPTASELSVDCSGVASTCEVWVSLTEHAQEIELVHLAMALADHGYRMRGQPLDVPDDHVVPEGRQRFGLELAVRHE